MSTTQTTTEQDILITSIHYETSVLEVYLNKKRNTITELKHKPNHRVSVYKYAIKDYLKQQNSQHIVAQKLKKALHEF